MSEFDRIIGYDEIKLELERICDIMRNTEKYKKLGVETPRGLLIQGEPGLGKTLMAECFIKESGRKTFICRKDKSDKDFVDEITEIFESAKKEAPSIIFLDDMDKFANNDIRHRNSDVYVAIQSCMDECRGTEVFVLATANDLRCVPGSLLRVGRFDKILDVEAPKYEDALKIIDYYLGKKKYISNVDIEEITKIMDGRSCAELETVINEAGVYAGFADKECIEMDDIVKACLRIIFRSPEAVKTTNDFLEEVAYHEAGHAVCSEVLEPGSVNLISVASYTGSIGGVTSSFRDPNYFKSKTYMENRVKSILGGRASTEIVFGRTDVGANSDLHRAFAIAERFVDDYCTYGFGLFERQTSGTDLANKKDFAINFEIERLYSESRRILVENREFLDKLAKLLMEKKTLLRKDIAEIKASCGKRCA